MSAWGTKWITPDKTAITSEGKSLPNEWHTHTSDEVYLGWDLVKQAEKNIVEVTGLDEINKWFIKQPSMFAARSNKVPTHDPYTNPGAYLYYECKCGAVLDPKVKRFAALNDAASEAGWKVRWGAQYYIPYCVECGKGVE